MIRQGKRLNKKNKPFSCKFEPGIFIKPSNKGCMDPSTPPIRQPLYCYDCGEKLTSEEAEEFRVTDDLPEDERENCRRLDDDNIFVPLCNSCYFAEDEEENSEASETASSYTCYCQGCGEEIDWDISKEEFENDNELHLCSRCELAEEES